MTASILRQPMPSPESYAEYERARSRMIDTAGRPLELAWCRPCNRPNTSPSNPTPPIALPPLQGHRRPLHPPLRPRGRRLAQRPPRRLLRPL